MKRAPAVGSAVVLGGALLAGCRPTATPPAQAPAQRPPETAPAARPKESGPEWFPAPPERDLFRYADERRPEDAALAAEALVTEAPPGEAVPPPPPVLRLVGLVRRAHELRAALATATGVVIVGPGDVVLGHTVLSLDDDRGLLLRTPEGNELALRP